MRRLALLLAVFALAGCGSSDDPGEATLWVTRDRGAELMISATVPAGVTAMQALRQEADVDTAYGGRFVEAIEGVASDPSSRRDWFYFVNGIEADRGAAEYRLRAGDLLWWDYRPWKGGDMRQAVVVGAFPEPFVHGYDGRVRPAAVRYESREARGAALGLAYAVGSKSVEPFGVAVPASANLLLVFEKPVPFSAALRTAGATAGSPVVMRISLEDAKRLLRDLEAARFRYQGLP